MVVVGMVVMIELSVEEKPEALLELVDLVTISAVVDVTRGAVVLRVPDVVVFGNAVVVFILWSITLDDSSISALLSIGSNPKS